ncbi:tRNA-specific adenosine deaminase [Sphingobium phage Lacusarx]|uniref:tRNA-specific adenosine deaminase n=1 Tax=Sphingobium phage Lacusarx TaxID=1980139 RepID=A0A1W6DX47_9CAUD|nr:tRNA-specific adenosine deaminase [Sphingobium phage Lacusarx]ARK07488.1 tRNA-specific adenosine deaminase [Sphingobium phage Lacusarx]
MSNWNDTFWLEMAQNYAKGSKDPSTKVGCVIVRPDRTPCSWGTNGFPQGIADTPNRLNDRQTKYDLTIHAELNALLFAPERVVGYTLYSTFAPCIRCAVNIIQAKISRVVFTASANPRWQDEQARSVLLMVEAGLDVLIYSPDGELVDHLSHKHLPPASEPSILGGFGGRGPIL